MKLKKGIFMCVLWPVFALAQTPAITDENARIVASLDSLTNAFHLKYTDSKTIDDMNVYGFNEDDIPRYTDSTISYRLSLLESEIPLEYNQHVKGFIDLYAIRKRVLTSKILTLSKYYFPMFEQILDQQKLPLEFKYLAVIESALNPRAVSVAGANGLWQFIHSTGLMYGLKINSYVDERRDPYKATLAACQYFKDSYALYNDWLLVIASYNCGPGNVNKAIRRSGGKMNFWEIMPYLPKETRGYVPAFIAATYVLSYHAEHNIFPMNLPVNLNVDTVYIDNSITFQKLGEMVGLDVSVIEDLNPSYKQGIIPWYMGKAPIVLPYEYAMRVADLRSQGGMVQALATATGIPASDILLDDDLIVNSPEPAAPDKTIVKKKPLPPPPVKGKKLVYIVKRGDGLLRIAQKYHCSVEDIKRWNKLKSNRLATGQRLTIYLNRGGK
ncbi:MAG: transglycosylase SLT domain-containing protein [Bacteroidia bacterium]|nr:transglycosylase SLT domain-containing protein [Bacteroidia bacterium]